MPARGRPKTAAATYEKFSARLPQDLLDLLWQRSEETGAPMNTLLVKAARRGLRLPVHGYTDDATEEPELIGRNQ